MKIIIFHENIIGLIDWCGNVSGLTILSVDNFFYSNLNIIVVLSVTNKWMNERLEAVLVSTLLFIKSMPFSGGSKKKIYTCRFICVWRNPRIFKAIDDGIFVWFTINSSNCSLVFPTWNLRYVQLEENVWHFKNQNQFFNYLNSVGGMWWNFVFWSGCLILVWKNHDWQIDRHKSPDRWIKWHLLKQNSIHFKFLHFHVKGNMNAWEI